MSSCVSHMHDFTYKWELSVGHVAGIPFVEQPRRNSNEGNANDNPQTVEDEPRDQPALGIGRRSPIYVLPVRHDVVVVGNRLPIALLGIHVVSHLRRALDWNTLSIVVWRVVFLRELLLVLLLLVLRLLVLLGSGITTRDSVGIHICGKAVLAFWAVSPQKQTQVSRGITALASLCSVSSLSGLWC